MNRSWIWYGWNLALLAVLVATGLMLAGVKL
jgi:hypothetical protein